MLVLTKECNLLKKVGDLLTIIHYNSTPRIENGCKKIPITSALKIDAFQGGSTNFEKCLQKVIEELETVDLKVYIPILLFMSDGESTNGEQEMESLRKKFPTLKTFTIGFGKDCNKGKLETLAKLAGGEFLFGTTGEELINAFETVSTKISVVYQL